MTIAHEVTHPRFAVAAARAPRWVVGFDAIDRRDLSRVGGKGANLGELTRAGFPVPPGFCVTTDAFVVFLHSCADLDALFAALEAVSPEDTEAVRRVGEATRARLMRLPVPPSIRAQIVAAFRACGAERTYAVRSSATAEDLPGASFAGQQDTYLNVRGERDLVDRVRECWVSLFTDRAITYRARNGFDHRKVFLSVVVQRMVLPEVSGILFTADPITGHRRIASIDAGFGLGEALVSGLVSADLYRVDQRTGTVLERRIADKTMAIRPLAAGGTERVELVGAQRTAQVLTEAQIQSLATLARRIEAHYGTPQDIEWCIEDDRLYVVQSRPITTLFPLPEPRPADGTFHLYISFGHAQVMTDAMRPFAHSVLRRIIPVGRDERGDSAFMTSAGGRIYLDLTAPLRLPVVGPKIPKVLRAVDAIMADALAEARSRHEFEADAHATSPLTVLGVALQLIVPALFRALWNLFFVKPEGAPARALAHADAVVDHFRGRIRAAPTGAARIRAARSILDDTFEIGMLPVVPVFAAGMIGLAMLRRLLRGRGVDRELDVFARGLDGNVTTEMDLALGDLADVARQTPAVVAHLRTANPREALATVHQIAGGADFARAADRFLARYGMRGGSEIDITRLRWRDDPSALVQTLIGNLTREESGSHRAHHARMAAEGRAAVDRMVAAASPWMRPLVRRLTRACRVLIALREHPKFHLVRHLALMREAVVAEATRLRELDRIDAVDDVWFLQLAELIEALERPELDLRPKIAERRLEFERFRKMTPPRVLTSDGESVLAHHDDSALPKGALAGSPASAGVVEGRAKVILDPTTSVLDAGEILIAPFTDPGWTPLFINAAGLVMEVGGLMTHGSVVAREYGIPAVVCVPDATKRIQTGQRIRVDGDRGFVQILD